MLFKKLWIAGIGTKTHGSIIKRSAHPDLRYTRNADVVPSIVLSVAHTEFIQNMWREGVYPTELGAGLQYCSQLVKPRVQGAKAGAELVNFFAK